MPDPSSHIRALMPDPSLRRAYRFWPLLGLALLLTRCPLLTEGYGVDPDAWLLVLTGRQIAESGSYQASRLPGFPVVELTFAALAHASPIAINGLTAALSAAAACFFAAACRSLHVRPFVLAALALAMTPVVFVNSTNSLDVVWALAFEMASLWAIVTPGGRGSRRAGLVRGSSAGASPSQNPASLSQNPAGASLSQNSAGASLSQNSAGASLSRSSLSRGSLSRGSASGGRPVVAGFFLGIAIGCRITSGALILPLAILLAGRSPRGQRTRGVALFVMVSLVVGVLLFAPVIARHGLCFFTFAESPFRPGWARVLYLASIRVWGVVGLATLIAAIAVGLTRRAREPAWTTAPAPMAPMAAGVGILLFGLAFVRHPLKAEYLIPAVPFVILLIARVLSVRGFRLFCIGMCLAPFVFGLGREGTSPQAIFSEHVWRLRIAGQVWMVDPLRGPVLSAQAERRYRRESIERVIREGEGLPGQNAIVVGYWLPMVQVMRGESKAGRAEFLYSISASELKEKHAAATQVYFLPEMAEFNRQVTGLQLEAANARPLQARR